MQNLTDFRVDRQSCQAIETSRFAIDDDKWRMILRRCNRETRRRKHLQRRADGDEEIGVESCGAGIGHFLLRHGLTKRDGGGFDDAIAVHTRRRLARSVHHLLHPVDLMAQSTSEAGSKCAVAMNLDDPITWDSGALMQSIDILCDDMRDVATRHEFGNRLMAWSGLSLANRLADHQEAPPCFEAGFLRSQEVAIRNRFVFGPEAAWRTKVRNAAFRRDACTGKDHSPPRVLDQSDEFFYVFIKPQVIP